MTGIFKINNNEVFGSDGTFSGTIGSNATFPAGHVIQVKGNRSNYNWGAISNQNIHPWTWCSVTMTPKQSGSIFRVSGTVRCENTGNGTFGVGVGLRYTINGGSDQVVKEPALHEQYSTGSEDMYYIGFIDVLVHNDASMTDSTSPVTPTSGLINASTSDTIVWTPNMSFNNSNATTFMGNYVSDSNPFFNTECIVMEIAT